MPRAAQPSTGSSTTRRAVVEFADDLVAGHERERHDRLEVARATCRRSVARSEPQMPARRGRTRTQPGPGSSGGSTSRSASGPTLAPPPGASRPGHAWRRRTGPACARTRSAFIDRPSTRRRRVDDPGRRRCRRRPQRADRAAAAGAPPGALSTVLDQPAPLAGEGGQPGLGVDRDREADGLEHRQVATSSRRRRRTRRGRSRRRRRSRTGPGPGPRRSAARRSARRV